MNKPDLIKVLKQASKMVPNKGQDDQVEARLSPGEFVINANDVALLGDGDNNAGAQVIKKALEQIRKMKGIKTGKVPNKLAEGGPAMGYAKGGKVKKFTTDEDYEDVSALWALSKGRGREENILSSILKRIADDVGEGREYNLEPYTFSTHGEQFPTPTGLSKKQFLDAERSIPYNEWKDLTHSERIQRALMMARNNQPSKSPNSGGRGYAKGGRVSKSLEGLYRTLGVL